MDCDYHFLLMSDPPDEIKYQTREDAVTAVHKLLARHAAEGFTNRREPSGRFRSCHPDGRTIEFWIDDMNGDIVGSSGADRMPYDRDKDSPASGIAAGRPWLS